MECATKEHATAIAALEAKLSNQRAINVQQEHQLKEVNAKCAALDGDNSTLRQTLQQQADAVLALKQELTRERATSNSRYVNEIKAHQHKYEQLCAEKETFDQRLDAVEVKRVEQVKEVGGTGTL